MYVKIMQMIVTILLSLCGLTPAWCASCGEMYLADQMQTCAVCGSEVCPTCTALYQGAGCYVCGA